MLPRNKSKLEPPSKRGAYFLVAAILILITTAIFLGFPTSSPTEPEMPIVHILLLKFKPTTSPETVQKLSKQMVALKDTCVHPQTHKPYITASKGGVNNSPEGHAGGMSHGYILEFQEEEERQYFLDKDPSHQAFIEAISKESDDYLVLDFTPNVF